MTESMRETDKKLKVMAERLRLCMLVRVNEYGNRATAYCPRVADVFI